MCSKCGEVKKNLTIYTFFKTIISEQVDEEDMIEKVVSQDRRDMTTSEAPNIQ